MHPAVGVPAPAISELSAGKTQMCLDFLIPASPSSFHRKDTEGCGSDSPEYPKAASEFPGASSQHVPSAAWKTYLWPGPLELGTTKTKSSFPSSCISALQPYVLDAWQMKIRDPPSRVYKSPMEGINKLNFRKKNQLFLKTGLILGKLAKPHEVLTKKPVKMLFWTIII